MCKHKVLSDYLREAGPRRRALERLFYVGGQAATSVPWGCWPVAMWPSLAAATPCRLIQEAQKADPSSFRASVVPGKMPPGWRLHLQQVLKTC